MCYYYYGHFYFFCMLSTCQWFSAEARQCFCTRYYSYVVEELSFKKPETHSPFPNSTSVFSDEHFPRKSIELTHQNPICNSDGTCLEPCHILQDAHLQPPEPLDGGLRGNLSWLIFRGKTEERK